MQPGLGEGGGAGLYADVGQSGGFCVLQRHLGGGGFHGGILRRFLGGGGIAVSLLSGDCFLSDILQRRIGTGGFLLGDADRGGLLLNRVGAFRSAAAGQQEQQEQQRGAVFLFHGKNPFLQSTAGQKKRKSGTYIVLGFTQIHATQRQEQSFLNE